jgi:predicted glycogen debranching enzyme
MAGYPWFTDWGRDTMIALPGLTLCTGNFAVAREILHTFSRHVSQGMLPNRLNDGAFDYNTADATLWFFEAARAYAAATGDYDFLQQELYPVLADIIEWHVRGTRYGIRMEDNGLLHAGEPCVQLTWMDAKIGDHVITPRTGKPVEIQALWHNALKTMEDLSQRFGRPDDQARYAGMATLTQWSFHRLFWNKDANCLYDVISDDGTADASIRPNQIFAVSLPYSMLTPERARAVVATVERELLTPFGLRTLSPGDPSYIGHYQGGQQSRDAAYHQGTVWPWLLGPFVSAYVRVNSGAPEARERAGQMLRDLEPHLSEAGLGQISEIFEGDAPHRPCGCFAQAWSVAEVLRALCQDVYQLKGADQSEHVAA